MKLRQKFEFYNLISIITPIVLIGVVSVLFFIILIVRFPVEDMYLTRAQLLNPSILFSALGTFFSSHPSSLSYIGLYIIICISILIASNTIFTRSLASSLEKPIRELRDNMDKIRFGSLTFEVMGSDYEELDDLAEGFDSMRRSLLMAREHEEQLKNERNLLIANISHDLKTPVTAINGYIDGINDGIANTPEKLRSYLNTIQVKSHIIEELVENLSTFAKLEGSGLSFDFETGDLCDLIYDISDSYRIDCENAGLELVVTDSGVPLKVEIDGEKMRRVFNNIIDNAIKYRCADSRKITIHSYADDNFAYVTVTDDGIGIDSDEIIKVFDSFYRTDQSRTSQIKGNGLGLGIAKQITEKHNGRLWLQSDGIGCGTTVTVCIPLIERNSYEKNTDY